MCYYETGSRNFCLVDRPVRTPDDLKGLKIRVMRSYWAIRTVNSVGASAPPIEFGELYTALQQGVVEGAENHVPRFYEAGHFEVSRYAMLDGHASPPDVLVISTHVWDKLTEKQREWLQAAANESVQYQRRLWQIAEEKDLQDIRASGVVAIKPDVELFRKRVQPFYEELRDTARPLYELVQEIQAAAKSAGSHEERKVPHGTTENAMAGVSQQ